MITEYSQFPSYDSMFMPVLKTYAKQWGKLSRSELTKIVYDNYYSNFSLDVLSWKSKTPLIYDRIHRALYTLFAWGFTDRTGRGEYIISEKWKDFLESGKELTYKYLITEDNQYKNSTFHLWSGTVKDEKWKEINTSTSNKIGWTPQELFENAYKQIETPKKEELLQKLREIDPFIFEKVVWSLCEAMWYWTFFETPKSHDWWIDWIIKWDSLWFEKIYIQAKRYWDNNSVQWKEMTNFVWALAQTSARKWIFFTTSSFADNAKKTADNALKSWQEIILIDWKMLVDLMFKYNVWVQTRETYEIKYIDEDFFDSFN